MSNKKHVTLSVNGKTEEFLAELEREMAGSVGAATAHAMVGQIIGGTPVTVHDLMAVADETAQMKVYSTELEKKITRTGANSAATAGCEYQVDATLCAKRCIPVADQS